MAPLGGLLLASQPAVLYVQLVLVTLIWGGNSVAIKFSTESLPPYTAAFVRSVIAVACLVALTHAARSWPSPFGARDVGTFLVLGGTGVLGSSGLWFQGVKLTSASESALLSSTSPAITALMAAMFLGEPFTRGKMVGLLLSIGGVALLAGLVIEQGSFGSRLLGYGLLLASSLLWAIFMILGKVSMARFSPLTSTTLANLFGTPMLLPFAAAEHPVGAMLQASPLVWALLVYAAVFAVVISWVWWYAAMEHIGASRVAVFGNIVPLFSVLLGALLLDERLTPLQLLGGALVVSSVWIINRARSPRR